MRLISFPILPLLFVAFFALSLMGAEKTGPPQKDEPQIAKNEVQWHAYDAGLKKALEEDKHVFIDFTAKWCGYCRKMDREVFSDPTVIEILNTDFVSVKVDGDSRKELDIDGYKITEKNLTVREFGVRGYPTFWFLKSDGTKLGSIGGYRPLDYMMEAFKFVKEKRYDSTSTENESEKKEDK